LCEPSWFWPIFKKLSMNFLVGTEDNHDKTFRTIPCPLLDVCCFCAL
jgi:hypothetical protein